MQELCSRRESHRDMIERWLWKKSYGHEDARQAIMTLLDERSGLSIRKTADHVQRPAENIRHILAR